MSAALEEALRTALAELPVHKGAPHCLPRLSALRRAQLTSLHAGAPGVEGGSPGGGSSEAKTTFNASRRATSRVVGQVTCPP